METHSNRGAEPVLAGYPDRNSWEGRLTFWLFSQRRGVTLEGLPAGPCSTVREASHSTGQDGPVSAASSSLFITPVPHRTLCPRPLSFRQIFTGQAPCWEPGTQAGKRDEVAAKVPPRAARTAKVPGSSGAPELAIGEGSRKN